MAYALVTLNQTLFGEYQANVTAWSNVQEDSTWLQDFADAIRASANNNWDNVMSVQWTLDNITVSFIDNDHITYSVLVDFTDGDLQGNLIGNAASPTNCVLVNTSFVGPKPNRGRIYFSGAVEADTNEGFWDDDVRLPLRALVISWRDGLVIDGINTSLQIARRPSSKFPAYEFNPVQTIGVRTAVRTQRRRQRA